MFDVSGGKSMKKLLCVVLSLVLALSMIGCGGSDAEKIIGTWEGEMDAAELLNAGMDTGDESMSEYIHADSFPVVWQFTFNEDGTCRLAIEEESFKESFNAYLETFKAGLTKYLEDMLAEMGMEMSVDELLTQMGGSLDDLVAETLNDEMIEEAMGDMVSEGKYKVEDGKLFLSDSLDEEINENVYVTYELDGKNLTLLESFGEALEGLEDMIFPMELEKVN